MTRVSAFKQVAVISLSVAAVNMKGYPEPAAMVKELSLCAPPHMPHRKDGTCDTGQEGVCRKAAHILV